MKRSLKIHKSYVWWLKLAVFFALISILYFQLRNVEWSEFNDIQLKQPVLLILGIVLVLFNIGAELVKWLIVLRQSSDNSKLTHAIKSLLSGFAIGAIGFNGIGNFLGRIVWFSKRERWKLTFLTLFTNFSQLLITIWVGALAFVFFPFNHNLDIELYVKGLVGVLLLASLFCYFSPQLFKFIFNKWKNIQHIFVETTSVMKRIRIPVLTVSLFRYIMFTLQFFLVLSAFQSEINWDLLFLIPQIYIVSSLIPSLLVGKLMVRESVSLLVLSIYIQNDFTILLTSLIIWLVNIVLPALAGLLIITFWKDVKRV